MNLRTRLKNYFRPRLPEPGSASGEALSDAEHRVLFALLGILADDETLAESDFRAHLDARIAQHSGFLLVYREAAVSLGTAFPDTGFEQQHRTLRKILRDYRFRENDSNWRKQLRLTSENIDLLLTSPASKRFRQFVVRDFLDFYFRGRRAWEAVGYQNYPYMFS